MLFVSTSGALGRYIDMPVPIIICSRAIIAAVIIFLFCRYNGFELKIHNRDRKIIVLSGLLLGLHWLTYFYALKLSNVAIGMISLFTYPVITTFLEPLLLKTKLRWIHLVLGVIVIVGILFLVPDFSFQNDYLIAIIFGIVSALFYSLRNILTKSKMREYDSSVLMLYQLIVTSIFLAPSYFLFDTNNFSDQISWIILLALLTTAIGHTWFVHSFKNFTVTSASIISSLQPVYGIIIGVIFLREYPNVSTIIGGSLILCSVLIESIVSYKESVVKR